MRVCFKVINSDLNIHTVKPYLNHLLGLRVMVRRDFRGVKKMKKMKNGSKTQSCRLVKMPNFTSGVKVMHYLQLDCFERQGSNIWFD